MRASVLPYTNWLCPPQIGRNYVAHAAEMNSPPPSSPFWFFKPSTSYLRAAAHSSEGSGPQAVLRIPPDANVHYEVELAAVIDRTCSRVSAAEAMSFIRGYAVSIDVTARAWQDDAKKAGLPWSRAKGADGFLPLGGFLTDREQIETGPGGAVEGRIWLSVNGEVRQEACVSGMTFSLAELIADVSRHVTLEEYDLILTGTPSGVGPLVPGDHVEAGFAHLREMDLRLTCAEDF